MTTGPADGHNSVNLFFRKIPFFLFDHDAGIPNIVTRFTDEFAGFTALPFRLLEQPYFAGRAFANIAPEWNPNTKQHKADKT
jgi:hypothetical protein